MNDRRRPRILVIRPDHLGDVLLTLPALSALRRALPDAHITFLGPQGSVAAADLCPDIDETISVPFPPLDQPIDETNWPDDAMREGARFRGQFDIAVLPRPDDPWSGHLVAAARVPIRVGYDAPRTRAFVTDRLPLPGCCHVVSLATYVMAAAARLCGVSGIDDPALTVPARIAPSLAHEREVDGVLNNAVAGVRVVLHPGSGWAVKNWPAQDWGAVAHAVHDRFGITPLITGGSGERDLVAEVVAASGGHGHGLAGELTLGGLAALYRRAGVVAGIDSGPLHLAAMLGTPVVALFGPADPAQFSPWTRTELQRVVRMHLPCSPCGNLLDPPCGARREAPCMTSISATTVVSAIAELLALYEGPARSGR
jgi:ADP-heptose:LPS heptosyltransferase